jgi:hypothetical protein
MIEELESSKDSKYLPPLFCNSMEDYMVNIYFRCIHPEEMDTNKDKEGCLLSVWSTPRLHAQAVVLFSYVAELVWCVLLQKQ